MIPDLSFSQCQPGSQERRIVLFTETPVSISHPIGLDGVLCHPQTSHYKASGDKAEMGEVASQRKCGVLVGRGMDAGCPRELSSTAQRAELVSDLVHICPTHWVQQTVERLTWLSPDVAWPVSKEGSHHYAGPHPLC